MHAKPSFNFYRLAITPTLMQREIGKAVQPFRKGFSLTELLVVIGIIVLLMGILLVALRQAQGKARETETEARMRQFINACVAFQAEHGFYPGVIPDDVLYGNPLISSTENALLHLMGGYRALTPSDDPSNTTSPIVNAYNNYFGSPDNITTFEFAFGGTGYSLKVDTKKMGEGPVINGKPYAPYFTPGPNDIAKVAGQLSDVGGDKIPDLVDGWGQPIVYCKQVRDRGPLLGTIADFPQLILGGVADYMSSTALGESGHNQVWGGGNAAGSIVHIGSPANQNDIFATLLAHPAFYKTTAPLSSSPRGALMLVSAGPDGIYFSATDGPNTAIPADLINGGPKVIDEYDDIRVFGGG